MSNVSSSDIGMPSGMDLSGSRGPYLFWVCVGVMVLSTLAVALRFTSRKLAKLPLLFDDWTILIALPCVLMPCILDIYCMLILLARFTTHRLFLTSEATGIKEIGFGKHVQALGPSPNTKIRDFWFHLWISNILYSISTSLVKVSILLFLDRIFKLCHFTLYASATGVVVILWGVATVMSTIFSCHPVQGFWDQSVAHTCINNINYALGMNIPNIIFDVVLMALPLGWLWRIRSSLSQKIALAVVFGLAGFVVAVGALRLQCLLEYATSSDFTWDFVPIGILTALETSSALICACLPPMSPMLRFCVHGAFSPIPTIPKSPLSPRRPGRQRNLSADEAAALAQITDGEAFKNHRHRAKTSLSLNRTPVCCTFESKPGKKKTMAVVDKELYVDMESGLEPPRSIRQGWATPKESRFSDW